VQVQLPGSITLSVSSVSPKYALYYGGFDKDLNVIK
jgi:hypothetical protein